jgi:hypothetical protein
MTTTRSVGQVGETTGAQLDIENLKMWDPKSGRCYDATDDACQMRMVSNACFRDQLFPYCFSTR